MMKDIEEQKPEQVSETPDGTTTKGVDNDEATTPAGKHNRLILFLAVVTAVVALAVGLSVGLTNRHKDLPSYPTFDVDLPAIGPESLVPYKSCGALRQDLVEAIKYLANSRIDSNARVYYHNEYRPTGCPGCSFGAPRLEVLETVSDSAASGQQGPTSESLPSQDQGEDSFLTNNQVQGVDEADVVKSDGVHVFAAYGNEIIVLDADNVTLLSRTLTPIATVSGGQVVYDATSTLNSNGRSYGDGFECSSSIRGFLLFEDRLVVISTGYCYFWGDFSHLEGNSILSDNGATRIFVYDISSVIPNGPLTLVGESPLQGYYLSARSINETVHVVTTSYVDTYSSFTKFLDRYNNDIYSSKILENEYRTEAHAQAVAHYNDFADELLTNLISATRDQTCSSLLRTALLQSSDMNDSAATTQLEFTGNGILTTLSLVTSFNVTSVAPTTFEAFASAMFHPTASWIVYASQTRLILAGQGWHQNSQGAWDEETVLVGYVLEGASSRAISLGKVTGYVLNQFSIDHQEKNGVDYIRIATTNNAEWGLISENPREWGQISESSSQVTVLQLPPNDSEDRNMTIVGQVGDIGRTERIYSVRFLGDRGYVVTFRQVDPFYTLDLSDPFNPVIVGELKIPGFSNYLHPIGEDLILGVGEDADALGRTRGLQISLFNVSNFSQPERVQQYLAENDTSVYSSSDAQYDHRAFRYLEKSKVLIIPVEIYSYRGSENFDGFFVYNIDEVAGITVRFRIEHADANAVNTGCWSSAYLEARSLVFSGDVLTLKGHTILSHDLESTLADASVLNLDAALSPDQCRGVYFPQ